MTCCLVEEKKRRPVCDGARNGEALALASGHGSTSFFEARLVTHGHLHDVRVDLGYFCGSNYVGYGDQGVMKRDIVSQGRAEKKGVLKHCSPLSSQSLQIHRAQRHTVVQYLSLSWQVETKQEFCQCALA